ncbi:MAG: hypothetical protein JO021_12140 [Alphaproteobacteria bacterium]|nr:hypothetical protein [Alphaproteobacteria bacterium]
MPEHEGHKGHEAVARQRRADAFVSFVSFVSFVFESGASSGAMVGMAAQNRVGAIGEIRRQWLAVLAALPNSN